MAITKDSIKGDVDEKLEARADVSEDREQKEEPKRRGRPPKKAEGVKAYVYEGDRDAVTLSIGGTNYEFRKGSPVHLPPGQSPTHPDIHEVK